MSGLRVLQFVNVLDRGGVESFLFNNLGALTREEVNFDFLLTRDQQEAYDALARSYGCGKFCLIPAGGSPIRRYISLYRQLLAFFRGGAYQIIHFQSNPPGIMATASVLAAWRGGIPIRVLHSHGAGGEHASYGLLRPLLTVVCRFVNTSLCTDFMAPTRLAAEYGFGKRIASGDRCTYIHNAVVPERFLFSPEKRAQYRASLSLGERFVVGTVGRFSEVKNYSFLLRVFSELCKKNDDALLMIVGGDVEREPDLRKNLVAEAEHLGVRERTVFYGEADDVQGMLSAMDVFLFPSRSEALGIAAIEAQLNGLQVVAAKNRIPPELDITGAVHWVGLEEPPGVWANTALACRTRSRHAIHVRDERIQAYDVRNTAAQLLAFYRTRLGQAGHEARI